ncbi:glutamic acid-rich protein-like isoform X2 [Nerophis ophidion]|uniref:glutamic acid-rich protein-like isoform X2 n=1 Tax=Nerophis ophidion TaxID=159077 RepID=UPI002ADF0F46|nr:glutamic acid-rich protein-like isoform X2 [Nerophis ophidion]
MLSKKGEQRSFSNRQLRDQWEKRVQTIEDKCKKEELKEKSSLKLLFSKWNYHWSLGATGDTTKDTSSEQAEKPQPKIKFKIVPPPPPKPITKPTPAPPPKRTPSPKPLNFKRKVEVDVFRLCWKESWMNVKPPKYLFLKAKESKAIIQGFTTIELVNNKVSKLLGYAPQPECTSTGDWSQSWKQVKVTSLTERSGEKPWDIIYTRNLIPSPEIEVYALPVWAGTWKIMNFAFRQQKEEWDHVWADFQQKSHSILSEAHELLEQDEPCGWTDSWRLSKPPVPTEECTLAELTAEMMKIHEVFLPGWDQSWLISEIRLQEKQEYEKSWGCWSYRQQIRWCMTSLQSQTKHNDMLTRRRDILNFLLTAKLHLAINDAAEWSDCWKTPKRWTPPYQEILDEGLGDEDDDMFNDTEDEDGVDSEWSDDEEEEEKETEEKIGQMQEEEIESNIHGEEDVGVDGEEERDGNSEEGREEKIEKDDSEDNETEEGEDDPADGEEIDEEEEDNEELEVEKEADDEGKGKNIDVYGEHEDNGMTEEKLNDKYNKEKDEEEEQRSKKACTEEEVSLGQEENIGVDTDEEVVKKPTSYGVEEEEEEDELDVDDKENMEESQTEERIQPEVLRKDQEAHLSRVTRQERDGEEEDDTEEEDGGWEDDTEEEDEGGEDDTKEEDGGEEDDTKEEDGGKEDDTEEEDGGWEDDTEEEDEGGEDDTKEEDGGEGDKGHEVEKDERKETEEDEVQEEGEENEEEVGGDEEDQVSEEKHQSDNIEKENDEKEDEEWHDCVSKHTEEDTADLGVVESNADDEEEEEEGKEEDDADDESDDADDEDDDEKEICPKTEEDDKESNEEDGQEEEDDEEHQAAEMMNANHQEEHEMDMLNTSNTFGTLNINTSKTLNIDTSEPLNIDTSETLNIDTSDTLNIDNSDISNIDTSDILNIDTLDTLNIDTLGTLDGERKKQKRNESSKAIKRRPQVPLHLQFHKANASFSSWKKSWIVAMAHRVGDEDEEEENLTVEQEAVRAWRESWRICRLEKADEDEVLCFSSRHRSVRHNTLFLQEDGLPKEEWTLSWKTTKKSNDTKQEDENGS